LLLYIFVFVLRDIQAALAGFGSVIVCGKDTVLPSPSSQETRVGSGRSVVREVSSQVVMSGFSDANSRWAFG
jgi:hypothetical protein